MPDADDYRHSGGVGDGLRRGVGVHVVYGWAGGGVVRSWAITGSHDKSEHTYLIRPSASEAADSILLRKGVEDHTILCDPLTLLGKIRC